MMIFPLKKSQWLFLILLVFSSIPSTAQIQESYEAEISRGLSFWRANKVAQAVASLKRAIKMAPDSIRAIRLLGQMQAKREKWKEARDLMNKVLEKQPDDLVAHYYLAICHRELGKFKALLLRRLEWNKAQKHFDYLFKNAPWYNDTFYQYAILERYRGRYTSSVENAEKQLRYAKSVKVMVGLHHLYDIMLFHEGPEKARKWLQQKDFARAPYYIGETYRRAEEFAKADSIFQTVLSGADSTISLTPVRLSLARLRLQQGRPQESEQYFHQAVDSIKNFLDADLIFEDIKYIASDAEIRQFSSMRSIEEKKDFFRKFWIKRNPMRGAPENFRLIEHYRRLLYAEKYYRYDGLRIWFNNPDKLNYLTFSGSYHLNDRFNDKGLVYLRLGEPDERAFDVKELVAQNESWLYYGQGIGKRLMFHFFIDKNATGNNWRLSAQIPRALLQSRLTWDALFQKMYTASALEYQQYQYELIRKNASDVQYGFHTERHTWSKKITPIQFPFYISTFRGQDNKTRYEVYYGLTTKDLWSKKEKIPKDGDIDFGFAVYDQDWNEIFAENRLIAANEVKAQTDSAGFWVDQFTFEAVPADYNLNLFALIRKENKIGGFKFKYGLASYQQKELKLSRIELARLIEPADQSDRFTKHGLRIIPQPHLVFDRTQPMYVYFEIYNLPVRDGEQLLFNITYSLKLLKSKQSNIFAKIKGLFVKRKSEITHTVERSSKSQSLFEHLAMDLSEKVPGRYLLTISAKIPGTEQQANEKIEFNLK